MTLAPELQQEVGRTLIQAERGWSLQMDSLASQRLVQHIRAATERMAAAGHQPVLLCAERIRLPLRRFVEMTLPTLAVLSYSEVGPNCQVVATETIGESEDDSRATRDEG
jgi:flagellar biosynthesis protein FlhA